MTKPDVDVEVPIQRLGFIHISISVGSNANVDALTLRLQNDGYEVMSGPRTTGDGYYESSILGPENMQIEITV
jgi:lactoylglutathione lyase